MTELERKLMAMTPAQRKKAVEHISDQMGMNPKILEENRRRRAAAKKATKKTTKKK